MFYFCYETVDFKNQFLRIKVLPITFSKKINENAKSAEFEIKSN